VLRAAAGASIAFALLGVTGCAAAEKTPVSRAEMLPTAEDLPDGAEVVTLEGDEQVVLSIKLDAPSTGIGLDETVTFDPPECADQKAVTDEARLSLVRDSSATAALLDGTRGYVMLVSETVLDPEMIADAHTGPCRLYSTSISSAANSFTRTVRTERVSLPPGLESDNAAIVRSRSDVDLPGRVGEDTTLGYARVGGLTVMVLGLVGTDHAREFEDMFTATVAEVQRST